MPNLPTNAVAAATFLLRHLYRSVDLTAVGQLFALAETERPCMGDTWFWTDDNAKALELLSRPELWRQFPEQTLQVLRYVRAMCRGPFIFRRVSVPRLEAVAGRDGSTSYHHSLMHLRTDLARGIVVAGMRFHDGRTGDHLMLTGNTVEFSHRRRRFAIDVEDAIDQFDATQAAGILTLRHSSELTFSPRRAPVRLGRIHYTYTIDSRSMIIGVEVVLDVDTNADITDVVVTVGHDYLSHGANNVHYSTLVAETRSGTVAGFAAGEPGHTLLPATGAAYYAIIQEEIAGLALAIHTVPQRPDHLIGVDAWVKEKGRLHLVRARYRFDGSCRGARLVVEEDKLLTAGGFYNLTGEYSKLIAAAVKDKCAGTNPLDLSISYDYGSEINAFAKCFAAYGFAETTIRGRLQRDELQALVDCYLDHYFSLFIGGHQRRENTIISRQLAFVILGAVTMYRATSHRRYLEQSRLLCDALLDFEIRYQDFTGAPAGGFAYGIKTQRAAFVDGHSACLLALTQAARFLGDRRLVEAVDRGLQSYCLETCRVVTDRPLKVDTVSTITFDDHGTRHSENAFWNFNVGLALRFFAAVRQVPNPALQTVVARHADRMDLLEMVMRRQIENSIIERPGSLEFAVAVGGGETNSETQPWVTLGLFGHPCD